MTGRARRPGVLHLCDAQQQLCGHLIVRSDSPVWLRLTPQQPLAHSVAEAGGERARDRAVLSLLVACQLAAEQGKLLQDRSVCSDAHHGW
jgi:hypothetical protein